MTSHDSQVRHLDPTAERTLEVMLVLVTLGLGCVLHSIEQSQVVVLNLFFLPIVLAAFYLDLYRAGTLALLSVVIATTIIAGDLSRFAVTPTPVLVSLNVIVWGAVLGLTALLVGALNHQRTQRTLEANEANRNVVQLLTRYLHAADPDAQRRLDRLTQLATNVALRLGLSGPELENMRRAAMLMDLENLELTARIVKRAVGGKRTEKTADRPVACILEKTFSPSSLTSLEEDAEPHDPASLGTRILFAVQRFLDLQSDEELSCLTPDEAVEMLRDGEREAWYDERVIDTLATVIRDENQIFTSIAVEFGPTFAMAMH